MENDLTKRCAQRTGISHSLGLAVPAFHVCVRATARMCACVNIRENGMTRGSQYVLLENVSIFLLLNSQQHLVTNPLSFPHDKQKGGLH